MTSAVTRVRKTVFGVIAAGVAYATFAIPSAGAAPDDTPAPSPAPVAADDCTAATLASTISSVTSKLSSYFAAHPDANQALIDATRQPAFTAAGQFDDYTNAHPDQANDLREIQAPLRAYQDRCGLQVSPTDALTVLAAL
jgi:hemophore-related protein